ncbi:MAG: hypothetical protein K9I85_09245 [Saprospiraceae bacterium]|nr:hypothetical protein [Saprospiraceae bacterium]
MKTRRLMFMFTFVSFGGMLFGQMPVLVTDLVPGQYGGFDPAKSENAYLGEKVVFGANNGVSGREPYILEDGTISLLTDINPGVAESNPKGFISVNDHVYFSAFDSTNFVGIWTTDGTTSGTTILKSFPGSTKSNQPSDFVVSKSNSIYFTFKDDLFRIDAATQEVFEVPCIDDVDFFNDTSYPGTSYCTYENGIAFLTTNGSVLRLWKAEDETELLAEFNTFANWLKYFGLTEVQEGIAFAMTDSFNDDVNNWYLYNRNDQSLSPFLIKANTTSDVGRTMKFNNTKLIGLDRNSGYFSMNGNPDDTEILSTYTPSFLVQYQPIPHETTNGFLAFLEKEFGFTQTILATDGTAAGTSILAKPGEVYCSPFISRGKIVFWAAGVSNNFNPEIWQANPSAGTSNMIYKYPSGSKLISSITPFCIQDDKLYFISKMDATVGPELYSIELEMYTDLDEIENRGTYSIINHGNQLTIATLGEQEEIMISMFDIQGKELRHYSVQTGTPVILDLPLNIYLVVVEGDRGKYTQKVFTGQ